VGPGHIEEGRRRGFIIKLIAAATTHDGASIAADVRPRLVPADAPMARVDGPMNAVAVDAEYAGSLVFEGPGAGPDAAASAVLADLIRAAKDVPASAGSLLATLADAPPASVLPLGPEKPYPAAS
jgi:homoserine dehydrogenase